MSIMEKGTTVWVRYGPLARHMKVRKYKGSVLVGRSSWYPLLTVWANEGPTGGTRYAALRSALTFYPWLETQQDRIKLLPFGREPR